MLVARLEPTCNVSIVHASLFISLIIYLVTIDQPDGQGIIVIPKDKALCTLNEYNMDHLCTYSGFIQVIYK